ncbi:MAG: hypothetical protein EBT20_18585, partial [Alphaproteobacteria bacterium]|nr:hypothetical protein [Alphaproteobacteria bacterium]
MSPIVPYHSATAKNGGEADWGGVPNGVYIINAPAPAASTTMQLEADGTAVTPDPATVNPLNGSGMTIQVTVSGGNVTKAQILNPGTGYQFHNVFNIPATTFDATNGTGYVKLILNGGDASAADGQAITNPGGMFSSNPPGATLSSVSMLDVLTVENAKKMLTAVDGALVRIDLERSDLGATMS